MKLLEKSVPLAISLKVAGGNVKYIFNIEMLGNERQNNIRAVREIFFLMEYVSVPKSSLPEVFRKKSILEKDCSTDVFQQILLNF